MSELVLPGYEQIHGATGRSTPYRVTSAPWRVVFHKVQGRTSSLAGFRTVAKNHSNGPHCWVDDRADRRWKLETVPINMSAKALAHPRGTPETNHMHAVQVEIAGYAEEAHLTPKADLEWLGTDVLAPIVRAIRSLGGDIDLTYVERTYKANEGIVLASVNSPIRYDEPTWRRCNWLTTHQRVIANSHWDCGGLNLRTIIAAAREALGETPPPKPPPKPPAPEEITVAEADRIIEQVNLHTDAKVLGLMSFALANQKTGVLWRIEGSKAPWYGRDGDGTYLFDFDTALEFKRLHEITESSATISQALHDAITSSTTVVNVSGKSVEAIAAAVSDTDADFINGAIEEAVQRAVQAVQAQLSGDLSKIGQVASLLAQIAGDG